MAGKKGVTKRDSDVEALKKAAFNVKRVVKVGKNTEVEIPGEQPSFNVADPASEQNRIALLALFEQQERAERRTEEKQRLTSVLDGVLASVSRNYKKGSLKPERRARKVAPAPQALPDVNGAEKRATLRDELITRDEPQRELTFLERLDKYRVGFDLFKPFRTMRASGPERSEILKQIKEVHRGS